ncbi:hypothetical protein U473_05765 [Tepidibacillus decaturensis]|uniref:Uncharacterized protein n=1 Tax=Tepidibacillus decaturensis TaxID=1413211 RepID=A0A135L3X8_9BACI|nr:hypothetical protein U473_05765 [Tepidibacillus decaturensis]
MLFSLLTASSIYFRLSPHQGQPVSYFKNNLKDEGSQYFFQDFPCKNEYYLGNNIYECRFKGDKK